MDVKIPEVPPEYDSYRAEVRSFIAAKRPLHQGQQGSRFAGAYAEHRGQRLRDPLPI